jgi:hypothetical protein
MELSVNGETLSLDLSEPVDVRKRSLDITDLLNKADNEISLAFSGMEKPLPYSINLFWEYKTPPGNKNCPLAITTRLNDEVIRRNETTRLSVTMENKTAEDLPMSIAIIGIPGGMSLQPWQLKELQEKEVFDFYEIIDDNLVIYYRGIRGREKKEINLDLKAEVAGTYTGMASSAYLYYTDENKYWIKGLSVRITE